MTYDELDTERLRLRMWRESDIDAYAGMCADPLVMRYLGPGKTMTRHEAWRSMAFFIGHWQLRGYGHWAVEEKATGTMIGRIGFLNPEGWPAFEDRLDAGAACLGKGLCDGRCEGRAGIRVQTVGPAPCHQSDPS